MSERDIVELLVRWRSVAMMLERKEFDKIAGDQKDPARGRKKNRRDNGIIADVCGRLFPDEHADEKRYKAPRPEGI